MRCFIIGIGAGAAFCSRLINCTKSPNGSEEFELEPAAAAATLVLLWLPLLLLRPIILMPATFSGSSVFFVLCARATSFPQPPPAAVLSALYFLPRLSAASTISAAKLVAKSVALAAAVAAKPVAVAAAVAAKLAAAEANTLAASAAVERLPR